jgi:ribosome biogenesis GTPase
VLVTAGTLVCTARGKVKKSEAGVMVGDRVIVSQADHGGVVEEVLPRVNQLTRPYVANVDQAIVVTSVVRPEPNLFLLDRILVQVEHVGLDVVVCVTKIDLAKPSDYRGIGETYTAVGYPVITTSTVTRTGVRTLAGVLRDKTSVFAGPSGAGKSALLNMVQPGHNLVEGDVSRKIGRGRHTTREVRLIQLDTGGFVADTPGFSALDIDFLKPEELAFTFPDIRAAETGCRFAGCMHDAEPGCAVKAAVEEGRVPRVRYENYLRFLAELREAERRQYR